MGLLEGWEAERPGGVGWRHGTQFFEASLTRSRRRRTTWTWSVAVRVHLLFTMLRRHLPKMRMAAAMTTMMGLAVDVGGGCSAVCSLDGV
jgi:hypothetical protein